LLGPESDIPAPDVYTNARIMGWIMDTYSMHKGHSVPGVVTGKPLSLGGSGGRSDATGRGCVDVIAAAAPHLGINLDGAMISVQGFGTAGTAAATILAERETVGMRLAAHMLAIRRVAQASLDRGIYP
jgi:glutamate dehydrogenase/leucine dehydrogenase